jgi:3',5'-cyclic-AMP phosphodiesterase
VEPTHTLIQLTDLHVDAPGAPSGYGVDTIDVVERALRAVEGAAARPAALVFTGDLTEHGHPDEYRRLRAVVEPVAARLGVPAVFVAGNHDDRAALREHLLGEQPSTAPLDHVVRAGDLRLVVLDSTVPGKAYGDLTSEQLAWLRAELAEPARAGSVLALHHPPLPSTSAFVESIELQQRAELAAAIEGTDVRIVLAGHTHVVSAGSLAGVPVWTGGAITFQVSALPPAGLRSVRSPAVSRIDLLDGSVLAASVPFDATEVFTLAPAELDAIVAGFAAELPAD